MENCFYCQNNKNTEFEILTPDNDSIRVVVCVEHISTAITMLKGNYPNFGIYSLLV